MKTSGLFTLHRYAIKAKHREPINLVFFGDVHRDSPNFADTAWKSFLTHAKSLPNPYFIGMGDYFDGISTSERRLFQGAGLHESTLINMEREAHSRITKMAMELDFMRGRLIGLLGGNHFWPFPDGTDSDQRLAGHLRTKFLGVCSFIRLTVETANTKQSRDLFLHHGAGAGRLPGGSINRVNQMAENAVADIYASGHDHKRGVWPINPRLTLEQDAKSGLRLKHRDGWLVKTGSFLAAYEDGVANYNVDAGRGPSSLGHVELEITPIDQSGPGGVKIRELQIRGIS